MQRKPSEVRAQHAFNQTLQALMVATLLMAAAASVFVGRYAIAPFSIIAALLVEADRRRRKRLFAVWEKLQESLKERGLD